jgi:hypothetical protein
VIEPRIYRATFLPALLAVVVAMFSLEARPGPLPQQLAADVLFDGNQAAERLREIERESPDRRPGTPGNDAAGRAVVSALRNNGFETTIDRFKSDDRQLVNVVGRRAGAVREQIVLIAGRDAQTVPDATVSAADTAALIEVARVLGGRAARKTLVLASVDGATLGDAGARRLMDKIPERDQVEAVLVLSNSGTRSGDRQLLVAWSNDPSRGSIGLERTAGGSLRQELGAFTDASGLFEQLAHLAFPIGIGAQGVLLEGGMEAIRITGTGELPPERRGTDAVDVNAYGDLGRGLLRTVSALDAGGEARHGPDSYLTVFRRVLPGWVIWVLSLCLILPAVVASVDAFARARRRKEPVGPWLWWLLAGVLAFAAGWALSLGLVVAGIAPDAPPAPLAPDAEPLDAAAGGVLAAVVGTIVLAWILGRSSLLLGHRAERDPGRPGAGCATALVLAGAVLAVWVINPYAALVLAPGLHAWILVALTPMRRGPALALAAAGLVLPAAIAVTYLDHLSLNPLEGAWYLLLLVTGHQVDFTSALLGCVLLGVAGSVFAIALAREGPRPDEGSERQPVRGPPSYAGPGSLGGTESALRR